MKVRLFTVLFIDYTNSRIESVSFSYISAIEKESRFVIIKTVCLAFSDISVEVKIQ